MNKVPRIELSDNLTMSRRQRLEQIKQADTVWDLIIVGGGIVGSGILKRACQANLKVLLVEQKDFAWGSSSRSSKMVHGGLRYIAEGQVKLTKESVLEREKLLADAPLLVTTQSFAMAHYEKQFPWPWIFNALLSVYDSIANLKNSDKQHKFFAQDDYLMLAPGVKGSGLLGGTQFYDALTDDARMVQRLIQESLQMGGQAINYCPATSLIKDGSRVTGVKVKPEDCNEAITLKAKTVVNATGAWTNAIIEQTNSEADKDIPTLKMRPLRGSHLVFPNWRLPVASVIAVPHPVDKRPVQIYPWLNVTVVGTTDVEHSEGLSKEAKISEEEFTYLMQTIESQFPAAKITADDVISTFAGIRPVVSSGGAIAPSKEKREHSLNHSEGLITVAGGKLTTFDVIAQEVLSLLDAPITANDVNNLPPVFEPIPQYNPAGFPLYVQDQAFACYGELGHEFIQQANPSSLSNISYSRHLWAELTWAAKYEQIQHLDDLMLRRTRLGNLLYQGGMDYIEQIKACCQFALNWSEDKWQQEITRYREIWQKYYGLPSNLANH